RVTRRELREMPLPPALRDEDAHRTAPSLAEEGLELFGLGQRDRRDDLGRQRAGGAVVQAEERRDDVRRRCALRSFEREVIAADDRAVAHAEDLYDGVTFIDRGGEHVEIVALVRVHLLAIESALGGTVLPRPSSPASIRSLQVRYGKSFCRRSSDSSTDFAFANGPKYRAVRSPRMRVRRMRGKSSPSVIFT